MSCALGPQVASLHAPLSSPRCIHRPLSPRSLVGHFIPEKETRAPSRPECSRRDAHLLCVPPDVPAVGMSTEGIGHWGALVSGFFHQAPRVRGHLRSSACLGFAPFYEGMTSTEWRDLVIHLPTSTGTLPEAVCVQGARDCVGAPGPRLAVLSPRRCPERGPPDPW